MIKALLKAARLEVAREPTKRPAQLRTPDEQKRRFAEVCARLGKGGEPATQGA